MLSSMYSCYKIFATYRIFFFIHLSVDGHLGCFGVSVLVRWLSLEPVTQKEKNKYSVFSHMYGISVNGVDGTCLQEMQMQRMDCGHSEAGREGRGRRRRRPHTHHQV